MRGRQGVVGSPAYMAPEILSGEPFHARCDVYSIGILLNEVGTRVTEGIHELPYDHIRDEIKGDPFGVLLRAAGERRDRPRLAPKLNSLWRSLVTDCWNHEASSRPMCSEILERLSIIAQDFVKNPQNYPEATPIVEETSAE